MKILYTNNIPGAVKATRDYVGGYDIEFSQRKSMVIKTLKNLGAKRVTELAKPKIVKFIEALGYEVFYG